MPVVGTFGQQLLHPSHRKRFVEVIPLDVPASHGQQLVDLLFGLCAFGDDQQSQLSGHVDHRFDDFQPFAGIVLIEVDEFHVKFDHIDVDVLEHVQRRIRRSEIIHQHRDVVRMQLADGAFHFGQVPGHGAFGDFRLEQPSVDIVFVQQSGERVRHIHLVDVHHGDVHGNRHQIAALTFPTCQHPDHGTPYEHVQSGDLSGLFQHGNEPARRYHTIFGVVPTHQRLGTDDGTRSRIAFGLQVEAELVVVERTVDLVERQLRHKLVGGRRPAHFRCVSQTDSFLSPRPIRDIHRCTVSG
ncbi:hypothetical protein BAD_0401 [Bifidobacterium adolescentis ATCC 15703]|uniref:Uncharacterized protein n=1 Tax=Bifidobacterium adolescentis (strain ATCC 15703 / DSM 20083 / NCTC 11814 / E194a) TaxID=367928 RepID=A1A0E9_BIFAA|nr:hypothetical protein BAD_0401 [Bifidobacterium adolescentis ATCC 15703]